MMDVDVEDCHTLVLQPQMRRRDRAVVEKTEAACEIAIGVMTGWTAERVSRILAVQHQLSRRRRHIRGRARRRPGAGSDRTARIGCMPAETTDNVGRIGRGMTDRMYVGYHLGTGIPKRRPGVPSLGEKAEIFRAMHPGPRPLPEHNRIDQIVLARLEPRQQPVGAFGLLGGSPDDASNQEELRVMTSMQFGIDGLHADAPVAETRILARVPASHCLASESAPGINRNDDRILPGIAQPHRCRACGPTADPRAPVPSRTPWSSPGCRDRC